MSLLTIESIQKENEMNVLLLAMSTLPRNIHESSICYLNNNETIKKTYLGQLEPVPMMLSDTLKGGLDQIIVLASKDTLKPIENEKQIETTDGIITISEKQTAFGFFEKRMKDMQVCSEIVKIELEQNMLQKAIKDTVTQLRQLKDCNKNFNLYLDMHGGPRDNQLVFDAIISLLHTEGIEVRGSYTVHNAENPNEYTIDSTDDSLELFEFVAGMNEFFNYARSTSLERLFEKDNDLVKCIRKVCDSIQLCKMDEFENNLVDLNGKLNSVGEDQDDNYLDLFVSTIKNDYGKLLSEHTIYDTLVWCMKKEFYQQALTIVESQVPKFLFEQRIITLENAESSKEYEGIVTAGKEPKQDTCCRKTLSDMVKLVATEKRKEWQNEVFENCIWKNCLYRENRRIFIRLHEFNDYSGISLKKNKDENRNDIGKYESGSNKIEISRKGLDIRHDDPGCRVNDNKMYKVTFGNGKSRVLSYKIKVNFQEELMLKKFNWFT